MKEKSEDIYEEFFKQKHLFEFSNYPKDWKLFKKTNQKVIGKMKNESEGELVNLLDFLFILFILFI